MARVAALIDGVEVTQALELIWQRVRRCNRYVEERAPWQLAKDPGAAAQLDQTLASLAEGIRVLSVLLHPYMPSSTERLLSALGSVDVDYGSAGIRARRGASAPSRALDPLFPKRT